MEWLIGFFVIGLVVLTLYGVYKNERKRRFGFGVTVAGPR